MLYCKNIVIFYTKSKYMHIVYLLKLSYYSLQMIL